MSISAHSGRILGVYYVVLLVLHDVVYPDTLEPIVAAGELLTYPQLSARFDGGSFMDNLLTHVIGAPDHASALEIVSALAEQI